VEAMRINGQLHAYQAVLWQYLLSSRPMLQATIILVSSNAHIPSTLMM
jgi:hypothetical protein